MSTSFAPTYTASLQCASLRPSCVGSELVTSRDHERHTTSPIRIRLGRDCHRSLGRKIQQLHVSTTKSWVPFTCNVRAALLEPASGVEQWLTLALCRTAADFDQWSWSNQVGTYQTYIYVSRVVLFDPVARLVNVRLSSTGKPTCMWSSAVPGIDTQPGAHRLRRVAQGETASSWLTLGSEYENPASTLPPTA